MFRHPEIPELPPGYDVHSCGHQAPEDDSWLVYAHGEHCDGIEPLATRAAAVAEAWRLFYEYDASADWIAFLIRLGAPRPGAR